MASTFTTSLKFNKPALGDAGWGTAVNGGFTDLVDQALGGQASINVGSGPGPFVLTIPDGASGDARNMFIRATGNPGGAREIQVPANRKLYFVTNDSDGAVTVKVSGQTGVVVPVGASVALRINAAGTDVAPALTYQASMTLGTALAATSGGTGQSSYAVGDLLYADTTTTLAKLASVATGNVLRAKGVNTAPAWEQVVLTTDVTGVLPAANGGTGVAGSVGALGANFLSSNGTGGWIESTIGGATTSAAGIVELATDAEVRTGTDTTRAITPDALRKGALVRMAAQATTSGTSIPFTGIPSWVKRITFMLNGVSTNGSSPIIIRIGDAGGIETTGYRSSASYSAANFDSSTDGFILDASGNATAGTVRDGLVIITNIDGNRWVSSGNINTGNVSTATSGNKELSDVLTQVSITSEGGTDTFDLGSVNVIYE